MVKLIRICTLEHVASEEDNSFLSNSLWFLEAKRVIALYLLCFMDATRFLTSCL